jgi:hypothetical protein
MQRMSEAVVVAVPPEPPWRTLVALGRDRWTGQLTIVADDRTFPVAFHDGQVVAAGSPLATDAAVRVALIGQLVSSTQVSTIVRRLAAAPDRDELELIAELAKLSPEQALGLRRRVFARRAARAFALDGGEITRDAKPPAVGAPGAEVDVGEVAFVAARENLSEERLVAELAKLGSWFQLRAGTDAELARFGFPADARVVLDRLRDGATLVELEASRPGIERRLVCAVVYALAVCDAAEALVSPRVATRPDVPSALAAHQRERIDTTVEAPAIIAARMRIADAVADGDLPAPAAVQDVVDVVAPVVKSRSARRYTPGGDELAPVGPAARDSTPTVETILIEPTIEITQLEPVPAKSPGRVAPRDLIGVTIADRYVIEQKLGVGPLGVVYRAHHTKLTRLFAIKLLHRGLLANTASVQRFGREAALAGALRHLNVVGVVDVGIHDGLPFLAMDHADGVPLSQLLGAPMPPRRAIGLLRQLCAGLAHAHDQNLIHRDLKPDNVIIEMTLDDEIPRIADFGTAILRDAGTGERLTAAGVVLGTPAYMAPEQALSRPIDHRADLYALGVLAYQMLTGVLPFTGSGVDIAVANAQHAVPAMSVRVPGLDVEPRLEALVRSLLEKVPSARPPDANAVRRALELLDQELAREPSGPVAVPAAEPAVEPARPETATKAMWKFEKVAPAPVARPVAAAVEPAVIVAPPPVAPVVAPAVPARLVAIDEVRQAPPRRDDQPTTEQLPAVRPTWPTFAIIAGVALVGLIAVAALARGGHSGGDDEPAVTTAGSAVPSASVLEARYQEVNRNLQALRKRIGDSATAEAWARFGRIELDAAKGSPAGRQQASAELDAVQREMARLSSP